MTHPTDEELDALVQRLKQLEGRMSFQSQNITGARTCRLSADAITALRTQLARREEMHDCAMKERDDATIYADEQKARADRAEAALAAQIEVDARIADCYADQDYCALGYPEDGGIAASGTADMIRREIRNQPHDRTALDQIGGGA